MKQLLSAVLACFIFSATGFAQTQDTIFIENKINGVWQKGALQITTRNSSCTAVSSLALEWNENSQSWVNASLAVYEYEPGVTTVLGQNWDASTNSWVNSSQMLTYYTNGGLEITSIFQFWDAGTASWINSNRLTEDFDDKGRAILNEFDLYSNNAWQNIQRGLITYDEFNRVSESVFQMWMNNEWTNNGKTTYNYSSGISLDYLWNAGNKTWTKFRRTLNDYIKTTALSKGSIGQVYTGSDWQNFVRNRAKYESKMPASDFQQFWDANTQSWVNSFKIKMDYFESGSQHIYQFEAWDANTHSWASGSRLTSTDASCIQSMQLVPVSKINNNMGIAKSNNKFIYLDQLSAKTNGNAVKRMFRPLAGSNNSFAYDLGLNSSQSQENALTLILSTNAKPQSVSAKTKNDAIAATNTGFVISPNPSKNYFDINLSAYKNVGNITLKLSDISGRLILQQKMNADKQRVYIPSLQQGIYIVSVISGKEIQNQKLLVE